MQLRKRVKKFIREHWDRKSPLLLGYSGGPDSKALLHCLLETNVPLHVAHVDHGWREESAHEAEALAKEAQSLGIPFHGTRLSEKPDKNLEDFAREKRLAFFRSLQEKVGFQAVVLGHHLDDVAETVLKRILEGAHLQHLGGMLPRSEIEGLVVFRPFLTTRKSEILSYLQQRSMTAFHDQTNDDPTFLRTRLRRKMLPMLAETLGKEVHENLHMLSERAFELRQYLEKKVAKHWESRTETESTLRLNLENLERIEARYLVQKAVASMKLCVARNTLELVLASLSSKPKQFSLGGAQLHLDGTNVCITKIKT